MRSREEDKDVLLSERQTHVTVSDGVHGEQVVAVAKLELDHAGGGLQRGVLRLLSSSHLLHEVGEEQSVFTHPLDRLQQVGGQIHLIPQLHLLPLGGERKEREGGGERGRTKEERKERGGGGEEEREESKC